MFIKQRSVSSYKEIDASLQPFELKRWNKRLGKECLESGSEDRKGHCKLEVSRTLLE